jgi:hypothetical protein
MKDSDEYTIESMIDDEDDPEIIDSLREERTIVDEIRNTTGLSYRFIGGIPTDQSDLAAAVLPVLAKRLAKGVQPANRWDIYTRFCTRHARPYLPLLLEQLRGEESPTHRFDSLMRAVGMAARDEDVPVVWSAIRDRKDKDSAGWCAVAGQLANRKTAPPEIVAELLRDLNEGDLSFGDIKDISIVRDRRIRDWFRSQQDSEDKNVSRLARKVSGKSIRVPAGIVRSPIEPNRNGEVESFEIGTEDLPRILREVRSKWGLTLPEWLLKPTALDFLDLDQWVSIDVPTKGGPIFTLWLRLEDYDTIETALTDGSAENSARSVN